MKTILILIVLAVVAVGLVYKLGGYGSFDPTKQGRDAKAQITPGMTLKQVVDIAGPGGKFHYISMREEKVGNKTIETPVKNPAKPLDPVSLADRIKNKQVPNGFTIDYTFSQQSAFEVAFDSAGLVTDVEDLHTMADLLDTRER